MSQSSVDDLVEWAERLPTWVQDALGRLLAKGELEDTDLDELTALAKLPYDGSPLTSTTPASTPKSAGPDAPQPHVSLTAVKDIARAGPLAKGPIKFSPSGLTVIYGDNGCGKSSLARVLKRSCRSLVPGGDILPSLHGTGGSGPRVSHHLL